MKKFDLDAVNIVWVMKDADAASKASEFLKEDMFGSFPKGIANIIGYLNGSGEDCSFVPFYGSHLGNSDFEYDIFG